MIIDIAIDPVAIPLLIMIVYIVFSHEKRIARIEAEVSLAEKII